MAGKYRVIIEYDDENVAEWWFNRLTRMINQSKGKKLPK